jgi:hypothetical protein
VKPLTKHYPYPFGSDDGKGAPYYLADEADAVIAEFRAHVAEIQAFRIGAEGVAAEAHKRIAELEAERDAARADAERNRVNAERYEWLRQRNEAVKGIDPPGPYVVEDEDGETHYPGGAELDAAIDAARGKE